MSVDISVIIPCYNCAALVGETLDSLRSDTFSDFEVICVNDGSKDNTQSVLEAYAAKSEMNIRVIRQENAGVSVARNTGVAASVGKNIVYLDSDDLLGGNTLEAISRIMADETLDVMTTLLTSEPAEHEDVDLEADKPLETTGLALLERYTYSKKELCFANFVYRKHILEEFGIAFTPGARHGEDCEYLTKYLAHCGRAAELRKKTYYYRIHQSSAIQRMTWDQIGIMDCIERAAEHLEAIEHPFARRFREYMPYRALFSVVHRFARGRSRDLYERAIREYPVKEAMRFIATDSESDLPSMLAARVYRISPKLFYLICIR